MRTPLEPYLALIQKQLGGALKPKGDDNAMLVARYTRNVLTQLLLQSTTLPGLQRRAIGELDALLDELMAFLPSCKGGLVLIGDLTRFIRKTPDYTSLEPALQRTIAVLLAHPGDVSQDLLKRICAIQSRLLGALHEAALTQEAASDSASAERAAPPLSASQLQALHAWFRRQFPGDASLAIASVTQIVGGGSKKTLVLQLENVRTLPNKVVLRADSTTGLQTTVRDEYRLLEIVHAAGLPVPRPIAMEAEGTVIGDAFIVVDCASGRNVGDHVDVWEPSEAFARGIARALAKLHAIPPEQFGDTVPGAKISTRQWVQEDMSRFEAVWRNSGHPSLTLELAYAWMKDHMELVDGRRALNHGDVGCHNMLVEDGKLTALLDWETVFVGNPAYDIAYAHSIVTQMMPWEAFLAEYEAAGGIVPSQGEMDFYLVWQAVCKLGYLFVARAFFHAGVSDNLAYAFGTQHLHQRCEHHLQKIIGEIYARA